MRLTQQRGIAEKAITNDKEYWALALVHSKNTIAETDSKRAKAFVDTFEAHFAQDITAKVEKEVEKDFLILR